MYTDEQISIAETFLATAVNSGVLTAEVCREMIDKIKCQDDVLLTYKEVQSRLKVSRSTVERMFKRKELLGGRFNGFVRFSKSSVDAIMKNLLQVGNNSATTGNCIKYDEGVSGKNSSSTPL